MFGVSLNEALITCMCVGTKLDENEMKIFLCVVTCGNYQSCLSVVIIGFCLSSKNVVVRLLQR